jgi:hypothetical protein
MNHPMPTLAQLREARDEFKKIEPRDFFYWSVTRLVAAVLDADTRAGKIDELVCALMMLLTTWNKNYYRFFKQRKGGISLEQHFVDLERVISKHFERLAGFRGLRLYEVTVLPEHEIRTIFHDFADVLGRVGAAKCLHLLAPSFFPLWDAAILKGYGMEHSPYRSSTDAERYVAFMRITKAQVAGLGDFSSLTENPLKSLDEYNYCSFTKKVVFA